MNVRKFAGLGQQTRERAGKTLLGGFFHFPTTLFTYIKKNRPNGRFFLLLNLFVGLALPSVRVELKKLDLALYLLLVLAGKAHVAGSRLELDETIL